MNKICFLCSALVAAAVVWPVFTLESSAWWRASSRAAAAPRRLPTVGLQVKKTLTPNPNVMQIKLKIQILKSFSKA